MRRRWKLWACIFVGLAALLVWSWMEFVFIGRGEMNEALAEWRRAGGETTIQAMAPENVEPDRNAALALHQAFIVMPASTASQRRVLENPYEGGPLRDIVRLYGRSLSLTHEAVKLPQTAWPVVYSDGQAAQRQHIEPARIMGRVLIVEALARQVEDDPAAAMNSIETGVRLGDSLLADPNIFSVVCQREIQDAVLTAYERIYRRSPAPPSDLAKLIEHHDYRAQFRRALMAEGAVWIGQVGGAADPSAPEASIYSTSSIRIDTAIYLRALRGYSDAFATPYYLRPARSTLPPSPAWAFLLKSLYANYDSFGRAMAESEARLALAKLAVRLRAYKESHGAYPATLDALGTPPVDPWDGKPIRYETAGDGFVAWSETPLSGVIEGQDRVEWRWEK